MATTGGNDCRDGPAVDPGLGRRRVRLITGETTVEDAVGIRRRSREEASAADLLGLIRGPWGIATRGFGGRAVTLREEARRVRTGTAPAVLASLRNGVVMVLGRLNQPSKAAAIRHLVRNLEKAIELLSTPIQE